MAACAWAGVGVVPPLPHGFTGVTVPEPEGELNHLTDPRVLKPDIMVFGFAAIGREGNASCVVRGGATLLEFVFCRMVDAVVGGGRTALALVFEILGAAVLPQAGGTDTPDGRGALLLIADSAGKGSRLFPVVIEFPQESCLATAERDDCAVLFLRVNTRRPLPAALETPGKVPLGPGKPG